MPRKMCHTSPIAPGILGSTIFSWRCECPCVRSQIEFRLLLGFHDTPQTRLTSFLSLSPLILYTNPTLQSNCLTYSHTDISPLVLSCNYSWFTSLSIVSSLLLSLPRKCWLIFNIKFISIFSLKTFKLGAAIPWPISYMHLLSFTEVFKYLLLVLNKTAHIPCSFFQKFDFSGDKDSPLPNFSLFWVHFLNRPCPWALTSACLV